MLKRLVASVVMVALGAFAVVFGEFDDSPGLQGAGNVRNYWRWCN